MRKKGATLLIVVLIAIVSMMGSMYAQDNSAGGIKLFIGQDNDSIDAYVNSNKFPDIDGITLYTNFYNLDGLKSNANWGAGRINIQEGINKHSSADLAIGLYMVEDEYAPNGLTDIIEGKYDNNIDELGRLAKSMSPRNMYLRVGYEFDGAWNHYEPNKYKAAYKYMVDRLRNNGVTNIKFVWQACTYVYNYENRPLMDWYPGDNYVDYVGLSFFFYAEGPKDGSNNSPFLDEALGIARSKNKPVMMAEVSPQYYQLDQNTYHWSGGTYLPTNQGIQMTAEEIWGQFFENQLLKFINKNSDVIKIVAYINADWDSQSKWGPPYSEGYWGDTRIQTNAYITQKWSEELRKSIWNTDRVTPTPTPTTTPTPEEPGNEGVFITKIEAESMEKSGPYAGNINTPFQGAALYANQDSVKNNYVFNKAGKYQLNICASSNNNTVAGLSIYIDGARIAQLTYTGIVPQVKKVDFNVDVGSHEMKFILETDDGDRKSVV